MTPRPRKRGSKDLPLNLYSDKRADKTYYRYKHPITGKFTGFGTDKAKAIQGASHANQMLSRKVDLTARVIEPENPFKNYLEHYRDEIIPARRVNGFGLSPVTITEQTRQIRHFIAELGHFDIAAITQRDIAEYLSLQTSSETHNKHRGLLVTIFKHAISDGYITANLPERILKKPKELTKRSRLTLDEYKRIYQAASLAIRNAMELSLNAIQRRADIQSWRFDCESDGYYYIIQSKTKKHGKAAYLRIPTSMPVVHSEVGAKTLRDIVKTCRDEYVCPYLIHEPRKRRKASKEKQHSMQLSPRQISDGFTEARKKAGIKGDYPPTFHELLSLGEYLRKQQGWTIKQIQTLRGHTSEKMTMSYIEGHEWTTVEYLARDSK